MGIYTLAEAYLKGKSITDINWVAFGVGVVMRSFASMAIGSTTGYPGVVGFIISGMETGFVGAGVH